MPPALRRAQILERVRRDGGASVADLARELGVSPITIHRDLELLASEGLIERVHGGARALNGAGSATGGAPIATAWDQRVELAKEAKERIAAHAARHVVDGETVFLDASSTALALARRLMREPRNELTVVTNSPAIAFEIVGESMHVVVTPGELDQHMRLLAGRWTAEFLANLNFAVAFVSAAGVTLEEGLTTARRPVADVITAARASARRTVALLDASKFGRASLLSIMRAEEADALVTDPGLPADVAARYRA
ncbi:MAG: DeoR/GlpR family DNA-binding transcription regulator, partial [Actinomycetota bacterium]|nr:DeoR/GlpR family DNA-binding transcription regulator [Actinomycetota bacterium]